MRQFFIIAFFFALTAAEESVTFCSWNLNNFFLKQPIAPNGESLNPVKLKPEKDIDAIIQTIAKLNPDILGLCELGTQGELAVLQELLKKAGLDYPYRAKTTGSDFYRSLGVLSKHPILETVTPKKLTFHSGVRLQTVRRGFLSTRIKTPVGELHFIGCHLKSKLPTHGDDQAKIRYGEALRLRDHLLELFDEDRYAKLITYGDFNDTRSSAIIRLIGGKIGADQRMTKLSLKSPDHTYWTHHWKSEDVYSRFDYIFLSPALKNRYIKDKSYIASNTLWYRCSDHRPLFLTLK